MKATIREISRQTGFSPATVSNALRGKRSVNASTSQQILKTAEEMGYFENNAVGRTKIRLVFFQADEKTAENTTAFSALIKGVEYESDRQGFEVTFHYLDRGSRTFRQQIGKLEKNAQNAVVLVGSDLTDEDFSQFASLSSPMVLIGYWKPGMHQSAVLPDFELAASRMIGYLTEMGHRRVGYLRSRRRSSLAEVMEYWFRRELDQRSLSLKPDDIVTLEPGLESSYRSMLQYLEQERNLPTALVADTGEIALGAMKALQERGYRVPDDVSVAGMNDLPFAQIVSPGLTAVSFSHEEIGIQAVRILSSLIGQPDAAQMRMMVTPKLIRRESVKDLSAMHKSEESDL